MTTAAKSDGEILDELASRLNHCNFSNADPERWHVERNEIVLTLRKMAKRLRGEPVRREHFVPARRQLAAAAPPPAARAAGPKTLSLKGDR